ncbi:hypothetical protein BU15DRAFT_29339, partial [Melanogaster broomeanus]
QYIPPPARPFTPDELTNHVHKINRNQSVDAIIEHPLGAIVEYPQTGVFPGQAIAHVFTIDPLSFENPKSNFQYSMGGNGGRLSCCGLLRDDSGEPVICNRLKSSCQGLKVCSARPDTALDVQHSYTSRLSVHDIIAPSLFSYVDSATAEIFMKTLALFCALSEHGCSFNAVQNGHLRNSRRRQSNNHEMCMGKLVMRRDRFNRHFICCQYHTRTRRSHLILRNLQEYDLDYLRALLENNTSVIAKHEGAARERGYGPLVPCSFVASPSEQKQLCPHWHRFADGTLAQGTLAREMKCTSTFYIYVPQDLAACPRVVVVCRNPHSHPPPAPIATPPPLIATFSELLHDMHWQLADATPRRVMLDSGFVRGLRKELGWNSDHTPSLSDLHPSLANLDHVRRLINTVRLQKFPNGTGYDAVKLLVSNDTNQSSRYVRCTEMYTLPDGAEFRLIVCMSPTMSLRLTQATRISIDTSFKRIHGWQEFEVEAWDNHHMRSVVSTRAFITSQSADAHFILFRRIFEIAEADTGTAITFHHIDGVGFESVVADGHKGQGLGLGMFCVHLCRGNRTPCKYEPHRCLGDLNPYDHLRRMYRLCTVHFRRNAFKLHASVTPQVYNAMLSLSSFESHPDLEQTLEIIRAGGKKAKAWLKDKIDGTKFALPALYFPKSLMPADFWKACPTTTNGNEQAHRSINRDGVHLTLLGGVMRGQDYDERAASSIDIHQTYGINTRDRGSTHTRRASRAVSR